MSAPGQKLREAHEALVRAREALEEARLWFPTGGVAAPALLTLRDDVRTLATRVGTCAGEFYFAGWLTPADVESAADFHSGIGFVPDEPPRLSAECADEEPADLEDVEDRVAALHLPPVRAYKRPEAQAWAEARLCAKAVPAAEDAEARTEALLPPAEVCRTPHPTWGHDGPHHHCPKCAWSPPIALERTHCEPCLARGAMALAETVADDKGERTGELPQSFFRGGGVES